MHEPAYLLYGYGYSYYLVMATQLLYGTQLIYGTDPSLDSCSYQASRRIVS